MKPNFRQLLLSKKVAGKDLLVDTLLADPPPILKDCQEIHTSKVKRSYLEACLLTGDSFEEISKLLGVPLDVVTLYSQLYYDVAGMDVLSKLEAVEGDEGDKTLKLWALSEGLGFIAWRLGKSHEISPTQGLQTLFSMCIYKAKEGMFNPNSAKSSIEAAKWTKASLEIAKVLKTWVTDSRAAKQDLELAIKEVMPEFRGLDDLN